MDKSEDQPPLGAFKTRQASGSEWVSLSEALTWIAFRDPMTTDELIRAVEGESPARAECLDKTADELAQEHFQGFWACEADPVSEVPGTGHFIDREAGLQKLSDALSVLCEAGYEGKIRGRGWLVPSGKREESKTKGSVDFDPTKWREFRQLDLLDFRLQRRTRRSQAAILWRYHDEAFDRGLDAALGPDDEAVFDFEVVRSELMGLESTSQPGRAPSVKAGSPPTTDQILAMADKMKARGLTGREIAKRMRHEPGFENVASTEVRGLIKGRWKSPGRPKKGA